MKVIVDLNKKSLKILENERSIFRGEYCADKLELLLNKELINEYPTITALLSNGRKIGPYTTDDSYRTEYIDNVQYTKATFTLSKQNGFTLSEGKMQVTVWMNSDSKKEAIGNLLFNVVNTTAFDDGDILISGDVEGTIVNMRVEIENIASVVANNNAKVENVNNRTREYYNIGTITQDITTKNNTTLNSVKTSGIYTFKYNNQQYLMMVSYFEGDGSDIVQTIFKQGQEETYIVIREFYNNSWYVEQHIIATESYVGQKIAELIGQAPETLNTLEELANALTQHENAYGSLLEVVGLKATKEELNTHINDKNNPHFVTKSQVGLGNVNNTSDLNKPISTATQKALDLKADISYVNNKIKEIIGDAGIDFDTLGELADLLKENQDLVEAVQNAIVKKADISYVDEKIAEAGGVDYTKLVGQDISSETGSIALYKLDSKGYIEEEISEEIQSVESEEVYFGYSVGTSTTINVESDNQIATSKAVKKLINDSIGDIKKALEEI